MQMRVSGAAYSGRQVARLVWRGAMAGLALLLLVLLAWVACNLFDKPPQPTPPQLALPAVPADTPLHRALLTLLLPPGGPALATMQGELLACAPTADCTQRWLAGAAQLATALAPHALLGERCVAALADARFAEPLPLVMTPNAPLAPHNLAASQCGQWLTLDAVAAAHAGLHEQALERLGQGSRLVQALLSGSHSLISHAVAWTVARRHYQGLAAVLALQPGWAAELQPLAAALPAQALSPQRWVAAEAAWQRGVIADLRGHCDQAGPELGGGLQWMVCRLGLGLLPEATRQEIDARWLARLAGAEAGVLAVESAGPAPFWQVFRFHNTLGRLLLGLSDANYAGYFARQADVELQRQTVALALALVAQQVPVAGRADWLHQQSLSARLQPRITLDQAGHSIVARPWASDAEPQAPARPIRVPLPDV